MEKQTLTLLARDERTASEQIEHAESVRKLEWLYKELGYVERGRSIVPSALEGRALARDSAPSTRSTPPNLDGFVIFVTRTHVERRESLPLVRTIGTYHVTFGGERLPGLEGATVERGGPGSNVSAGQGVRTEAGTYPLTTYRGATERYATLAYAANPQLSQRPWPAIGIGETGARAGILIHPAAGFIMSIGTINLSKPLGSAVEDMNFQDSAGRVVALIDAMKSKLGTGFPDSNNARIPNAWLVIAGEP